ncbi:MAG: C40 family peptidase [Microcella sp.]|uniref:C40 family peptidase n=1 Tax=Microcella sp. TaxID=1913979 RepID=UPI0024C72F06|nr:C40 family peptidase [Microcella sp.]UYN82854.1 MAG: C40 family peptidase [Microcella sp.]
MRRPEWLAIRVVTLVTALVLALGVTSAHEHSALAAPNAPSWDDVEAAKGDVAATEIAISRIIDTVRSLEEQYAAAAREALARGEALQLARAALDDADHVVRSIERQRDAALERADTTARQAAQVAAQLSRAGGGDITAALVTSGDDADALLYRLGTMSILGTRADAVMALAVLDRNVATSLGEQAAVARAERELRADEAQTALDEAAAAAAQAEARVAEHETTLSRLSAQLATLTGRSAALEREYLDSIGGGGNGGGAGGGDGGGSQNPGNPAPSPSNPAPSPSSPAPSPSSPAPSPSTPPVTPPPSGVGPPNATIVNAAIAFARAQLGKPYQFGGSGPNSWDCSGLTMMSYSAAGLAIGGHSVSAQYNRAATRGQLLPYAQAQPGDLIFYSYGGSASGSKYHVTLYIGNGQMLEAPSPGNPVRIVTVRNYDRIPVVARPSA